MSTARTICAPEDFDDLSSIAVVTELVPSGGPGSPIHPATFAAKDDRGNPNPAAPWEQKLALTESLTMPDRHTGWNDVIRDASGGPIRRPAVLINSIPAEAHHLSDALRASSAADWGRIIVQPWSRDRASEFLHAKSAIFDGLPDEATLREAVIDVLTTTEVDSWDASHRIGDALIRTAEDPSTGRQVWQGGDLKRALMHADPTRDAEWIWRNAANAVLFGFWVSHSRDAFRPKWGRVITSEIVGYGVDLIKTGTVKGSAIGDVDNDLIVDIDDTGALIISGVAAKNASRDNDGRKPSSHGFGQIPGPLGVSAVSCELILRRSDITLTHLRQLRLPNHPQSVQAAVVRAAAAASVYACAIVATNPIFLRSRADLAPIGASWTARTRGGREQALSVDPDGALAVLRAALADLDELGLPQATPIELTMSDAQAEMIARAAVSGSEPSESRGGEGSGNAGEETGS